MLLCVHESLQPDLFNMFTGIFVEKSQICYSYSLLGVKKYQLFRSVN